MKTFQVGGIEMELPACPVCQEEYEVDNVVPIIMECGHSICRNCLSQLKDPARGQAMACPTCRATSGNWDQLPKNYKLEEAVSIIKKLQELPPPPENPVKCSSCTKVDDEADMYMCRNCILDFYGKDIRESLDPQDQSDIEAMALCGSCALRNHVTQRHDTIPYFSISSGFLFSSQLTSVNLLRKELQNQVSRVGEWAAHFGESARLLFNELDKMTAMMMKSKSNSIQRSFAKSIGDEITAFSDHAADIVEKIKSGEDVFEERFNLLKAKNKVDEATNCREIVSKEAEKKCIECLFNQPREKMYCCQECSQIVKSVLNGTLTGSDAKTLYFDTLLVCADCMLQNHYGTNHKRVKFTDVVNSYELVKLRHRVERKEEALRCQFLRLTDTFQGYTRFLHNYEEKITQMSKIAAECRGDLNNEIVLREFEKTLDDAELSIQSLQVNTEKENAALIKNGEKTIDEEEEYDGDDGEEHEEDQVDEQMNDEVDA